VGRFGAVDQAATSAALACTNLSTVPVEGLRTALTAAVGKSIGAGKNRIAAKQTLVCLRISLIYMGIVGLGFLLFGHTFMRLWTSDDKVIQIGAEILVLAAIYQVFFASRTVYSGALRGAGDTMWLAGASAFGVIVVLGLGGFAIIKAFPNFGAIGPWAAATLSIISMGLANRLRFKSNKWRQINLFAPKAIEIEVNEQ
jgi:MATE family multidrug resistance protein